MSARLTSIGARVLLLALALWLTGCLSWRVTSIPGPGTIDPSLKVIALAPGDGLLTDLIGFALAEEGYSIVDTGTTLALLVLLQERQENILTPQVTSALRRRHIDAILAVHQVENSDHLPQKVTAQLYSTGDATMLCHSEWYTGWSQRGPVDAAREIATTLLKCLERPSDRVEPPSLSDFP